ncbi:MAG: hypothetical protein ABSG67_06350 [Thermoguttaceae bacterium]
MPRLLVERFTEDSISQFRASAVIRNQDAWELYYRDRFSAAIYLWGYAVEMTLKSAWFSNVLDYADNYHIEPKNLYQARDLAQKQYNTYWNNLHDIEGWAKLIISHRMAIGRAYINQNFSLQVVMQSQNIYSRWREILRYKKNRAYHFEAIIIAESTGWFLSNSAVL